MTTMEKDGDAVLDFSWLWENWLAPDETIVGHEIITDGVTVESDNRADSTVVAWLSGGEPRTFVPVTCRVTTSEGRVDDRTITLRIVER